MKEKEGISVEDNLLVKIYGVKKEHYDKFMDWCRANVGGKPNLALHVLVEMANTNERITRLEMELSKLKSEPIEVKKELKSFGKVKKDE